MGASLIKVGRNAGTLLLMTLAFPLNLAIVVTALLASFLTAPFRPRTIARNPKKILLTGGKMTKSLQLARSFHRAGHQVYLVETHKYWLSGHRFSQAVKQFYTVPAPERNAEGYCQALLEIVRREEIDVFIPVSSPVASYYDALAGQRFPERCEVLHFTPEVTEMLDDKFALCQQARSLGLSAPEVLLVTDPQQVLDFDFAASGSTYILKSIRYDSVSRLDLTRLPFAGMDEYVRRLPIGPDNPWVMQEYITGREYCTHSTVRDGRIRLHCCAASSPFQVNYAHLDKPEIFAWVESFARQLNLTGQLSFDFIQTETGAVYPIECNPRTHSAITMFYNHPGLAEAYLGNSPVGSSDSLEQADKPIFPLPSSKPTYWLYQEIWRLTGLRSWQDLRAWLTKISQGKDAIFQFDDPLPFLAVPHWQITLLLLESLRQLKDWIRIDFNIGKLVESGGD